MFGVQYQDYRTQGQSSKLLDAAIESKFLPDHLPAYEVLKNAVTKVMMKAGYGLSSTRGQLSQSSA